MQFHKTQKPASMNFDEIRPGESLNENLQHIRSLQGILPICSKCKKIRDDKGYWKQIESYISEHSEADFSHSICPECAVELYGKEEKEEIDRYG